MRSRLEGRQGLNDLPAKAPTEHDETYRPKGLVIEAYDEEALRLARERSAARIRLLWENRRFVMRAAIWGLMIATVTAFLIPKRYKSTAQLMPPDQDMGSGAAMLTALTGQLGGGLAGLAQSALGFQTTGDMFIGILKSDTVLDSVIHRFNLKQVYGDRYIEDTRDDLRDNTDIEEDQKSGIITITVTDHDPVRAAGMAKEYVNKLNWVVTHLSTSSAHRERVFLEQRLKEVTADLQGAEEKFSQFASQKGAIDIPAQGKAMVEAAAELQGQLIAAEAELEALRRIYTDNNVRVRSLQANVSQLRSSLEKLAGAGANEKSTVTQLYPSLRELPLLGVTYADLLRKTKVEEAVFETLTQEYELAKVQEAKEIPSVKVLDEPAIPDYKSFPPRLVIMALGTMFAAMGAIAWILVGLAWRESEPNDPRKAVAIEVWTGVQASLPWNAENGSRLARSAKWLEARVRRSMNGQSGERKAEKAVEEQAMQKHLEDE